MKLFNRKPAPSIPSDADRLLAVQHDALWPESGPVATLRSAAAHSAYLRRAAVDGDGVREFLVLDPDFPRSMRRSAVEAEEAVRSIMAIGAGGGTALLLVEGLADLHGGLRQGVGLGLDVLGNAEFGGHISSLTGHFTDKLFMSGLIALNLDVPPHQAAG